MLLSLPIIAVDVPARFDFGEGNANIVRLALGMSERGLLGTDDAAPFSRKQVSVPALRQLVETGWLREAGPLYEFKTLTCAATLVVPQGADGLPWNPAGKGPECGVVFNGGQGETEWITVGSAAERLESLHPRLGLTAMRLLDWALTMGSEAFTPIGALGMARYLYWDGEDDETAAIESRKEEGEDTSDLPTRAALFDAMPEWAYAGTLNDKPVKMLTARQMTAIAKRQHKTADGALLDALARLALIYAQASVGPPLPDWPEDSPCAEPMAALIWSESDELPRIYDDFWQMYAYGEQAPYTGVISFPLTADGISEGLARVRQTGLMLRALDDILTIMKEPTQ